MNSMNKIDVIGLGSGDLDQLPYGIYKRLKESSHAYLRTKEHPVVRELEKEGSSMNHSMPSTKNTISLKRCMKQSFKH